ECLKKMYSLLPKHKASEKLQAELKTKISDTRKELEQERRHPKKAGVSAKFPKQGAGQNIILGGPNVGKSQFLRQLSTATPAGRPCQSVHHARAVGRHEVVRGRARPAHRYAADHRGLHGNLSLERGARRRRRSAHGRSRRR